jgi:gluconolactonase
MEVFGSLIQPTDACQDSALNAPASLGFQGVYRIAPAGSDPELMVNRTTFDQPNGLTLSPCERFLYVNDTVQKNIRRFELSLERSNQ